MNMWRDFYENAQYWKQSCERNIKYAVEACMGALLSLEILQAGAVKGLRSKN